MKLKTLSLAVALGLAVSTGQAATINAIIGNFDVAFDGANGEISDFNRRMGGNLNPAEARTISSFEVEVGDDSILMLMAPPRNLFADLLVDGLDDELQFGSLVSNTGGNGVDGFGFDFFTAAGDQLRIEFDEISYTLVQTPISSLTFFNFFAEGTVVSQNLPNNISFDGPVLLSFSATEVMVTTGAGGGASRLVASGAMTITGEGTAIPEPSAAVLALLGVAGAVRRRV